MDDINTQDDIQPLLPAAEETSPPTAEKRRRKSISKRIPCAMTGRLRTKKDLIRLDTLSPALADRIRTDFPDLPDRALIDRREVNRYSRMYVEELLRAEHGEFTELDRQVVESISNQNTIAENVEEEFEGHRTIGERFSDILADFGGSWSFLISFAIMLLVWMTFNSWVGEKEAFDPYPFILLNLVLSTLAAIQAPIIMMSQNRQDAKDRARSLNDYRVNLKAELEIRHVHEKLDYLISRQWARMAEIQQIQMDLILQKTTQDRSKVKSKAKTKAKKQKALNASVREDEAEVPAVVAEAKAKSEE